MGTRPPGVPLSARSRASGLGKRACHLPGCTCFPSTSWAIHCYPGQRGGTGVTAPPSFLPGPGISWGGPLDQRDVSLKAEKNWLPPPHFLDEETEARERGWALAGCRPLSTPLGPWLLEPWGGSHACRRGRPSTLGPPRLLRQAGLYLTGCGPPRPCGVQDPGVGFLDLGTGRQQTQGDARRPAGRLSPLPRPQVDLYGFGADGKGNWHHYWENNPSAGAFRKTGVHDGDFESNVTATLASIDKIRIFKGR